MADFENKNIKNPREAWKFIKELSSKTKRVKYIQGEDRLGTWKDYFYKLLSADNVKDNDVEIEQVSELHPEISSAEFFAEEANIALKAMKPDTVTRLGWSKTRSLETSQGSNVFKTLLHRKIQGV